ncbi:MAG: MlaD family protein [Pseudomonadales bacterium]|jgi:phospholipid/cholesterol/gamma-HCH transport system substrate-binding protein|nr:MlaD family protein [Pseudomonadales bacterium]
METRASYVLIGSFALAVVVGAVLFVLWLGKLSLDREWDEYEIVFEEAVTGLTIGSAVQYNGIQVGEVRRLSLAPDDPRIAIARIRVGADTPVKAGTHARLTFTGVTGVAIIQLTGGAPDAPPLEPAPGRDVPRIVADTSAIQNLLAGGEGMVENVNALFLRLSVLLRDDNLEAFSATLGHVEAITETLAGRTTEIDRAVTDLASASRSLASTLERSDALLGRLEGAAGEAERAFREDVPRLTESARSALGSLERTSATLEATLEENREAVTRFARDGLGEVEPTLEALQATLVPLRRLVERLEQQPGLVLQPTAPPEEYAAP